MCGRRSVQSMQTLQNRWRAEFSAERSIPNSARKRVPAEVISAPLSPRTMYSRKVRASVSGAVGPAGAGDKRRPAALRDSAADRDPPRHCLVSQHHDGVRDADRGDSVRTGARNAVSRRPGDDRDRQGDGRGGSHASHRERGAESELRCGFTLGKDHDRRNPVTPMRRGEGPLTTRCRLLLAPPGKSLKGHFDPFPPPRLNGRCPFRRYVLVPWSAARPDVQ